MKKTNFNNPLYLWIVIVVLTSMLLWNIYWTTVNPRLINLLPIAIQTTLLILIYSRHRLAKPGIRIWAIIFLIIAPGFQFFGRLMQDWAGDFSTFEITHYLKTLLMAIVGVYLEIYADETIEIVEEEKGKLKEL